MRGGIRWYLAAALILVGLAGCGRWLAEREPWRHEAEVSCLKSGSVKVSPVVEQLRPIQGPGICGADFPLKVAALGQNSALGFAENIRPPGAIPQSTSSLPRQLQAPPSYGAPSYGAPVNSPQGYSVGPGQPDYRGAAATPSRGPSSLDPADSDPEDEAFEDDDDADEAPPPTPGARGSNTQAYPQNGARTYPQTNGRAPSYPYPPESERGTPRYSMPPAAGAPRDINPLDLQRNTYPPQANQPAGQPRYSPREIETRPLTGSRPLPPLGPNRGMNVQTASASIEPPATLACPLVSALDRWFADAVQPSAQRWFGQPVAEIKQISAYSCRGMNGQAGARISEHAFGNALDIAAFTLSDGRRITVKDGWRGSPEEQGFLRDVQAAACQQFSTVLAPGSNSFHYDHIHVDLMRRGSGRRICNPEAIPGDVVAARAAQRNPLAQRFNPNVTGSMGPGRLSSSGAMSFAPAEGPAETDPNLPRAVPGED